jgi:hypothetical protein
MLRNYHQSTLKIKTTSIKRMFINLVMVVYICNPSYSRGGSRRIISLRLAQAKLQDPISKTKYKQKGWRQGSRSIALA